MSTFFRFTGMGLFVTAGAAVAICIATSPFDGPFNSRRKDVAQSAAFLHPLNAFPRVLADVTSLASNDSAASSPANSLPNVSSAATVSTTATTAANHSFENVGAPYQTSSSPDAAIAYPATDGNPTVANRAASETSAAAPPDVRLAQAPGALPSLDQLPGLLDSITKQADQNSSAAAEIINRQRDRKEGEVSPPLTMPAPTAAAPERSEPANRPVTIIQRVPGEGDDRLSLTIPGEDITRVLQLLSAQGDLNILASKSVQGNVSASLKNVDIETALDAILKSTGFIWWRDGNFIHVGTAQDRLAMQQAGEKIATRLYRPNYVKAADLQTLVTPLLTEGVGTISITTPAAVGISPDANAAGGDAFAGQEALLVKDYEIVLAEIDQIVAQVDQRPTQVAIEAMILSVNLSDKDELGVDFEILRDKSHIRVASGNPLGSLAQMDFTSGGLKVGFLDDSLAMFLNALETIGDTHVIATPRLMCINKHKAEILIGEQLGYVSTTQTETSTTQSVEFLEVGTQLRIRPFISSDGMVRMEVHPELSTGNVRIVNDFTLPDKQVTQVTTNIMVRDGCTVIIGGLIRDEMTSTASQIPLLGSLPVIGPAFRKNVEELGRQEILVLITPRIIYEPEACCRGDLVANEFHHRQAIYADQMLPFSKRYLGRKYFRLAQMAWDSGNARQALRLVNLAIHFDPMSRAAIDLRADIWNGSPVGDHTLPPERGGPALEGETLPPWLIERLDPGPDEVNHPVHPGRPGNQYDIYRPTPEGSLPIQIVPNSVPLQPAETRRPAAPVHNSSPAQATIANPPAASATVAD